MNSAMVRATQNAFVAWLLDAPPIAHPYHEPTTITSVRFTQLGEWPTLSINNAHHAIVGVFPSGWLSIANIGWRYFRGSATDLATIVSACNASQVEALSDKAWFDNAMRRHGRHPRSCHIGGLPTLETEDYRQWIRLEDITRIDVKAAFECQMAGHDSDALCRIQCDIGPYKMDETFADAETWWLFARGWLEKAIAT